MKKHIIFLGTALLALVSCTSLKEEFQPVFTGEYELPDRYQPTTLVANTTIAQLAALNTKHSSDSTANGVEVIGHKVIEGRVSTTDQPGNFYKSLYIQDATGGMEIKIGKNGLYNEYLEGQRLVIDCDGLYVGEYGYKSGSNAGNGMISLGYTGEGTKYQTSYLEVPLLIYSHIQKGDPDDIQIPEPVVMNEDMLPASNATLATCPYLGKKVTLRNLTYGWYDTNYDEFNEAFVLLYLDSQKNKSASSNRIFVSGANTGITTWAMSKQKMTEYLTSGIWDNIKIGNANEQKYGTVGDRKGDGTYPGIEKAAASVSQYFSTRYGTGIQIRTSGYCKFADIEIPKSVLDGEQSIDVTGILTLYQGKIQITVNDLNDIKFN